jgi:chitodextrinase
VNVSWTASTDNVAVVGYRILRDGTQVANVGAVTTYQNSGLTPSTTYSFAVVALDAAGNASARSTPASATTPVPDLVAPSTPAGLGATPISTSRINLAWTAATDNVAVTGYRVRRDGALIATLGNATSYASVGLVASTTYSYTVQALDADGNASAESAPASATTLAAPDTTPPSVPGSVNASAVSSSQINLSWVASTDNVAVTGYVVRRNGAVIVTTPANVTTYQNTGLAASTTYSYTVQAQDAEGNVSSQSAPASATTQAVMDTTPPSIPAGLSAVPISPSQINLSWSASTDDMAVTGYRVYRGGVLLTTVGNVTAFQNTGLAPATVYSYTVQALDAAGNASAQSAPATATTLTPGSINVSLVASRLGGVAPLAVFFDASGTTASASTSPFHDLEYRWDFGDPAGSPMSGTSWPSRNGNASSYSRNVALGPVAAHVFENPGTYTVTLSVFDGSSTATGTVQITVADPNAQFSGGNTICIRATAAGDFSGCPSGAQQITNADWDNAINTNLATGRRLLFRRGDAFVMSASAIINVTGPGLIGAFGSGARPIVTAPGVAVDTAFIRLSSATTPTIRDWRVMDLEFDGGNVGNAIGVYGYGGFDQFTLLRMHIHHLRVGVYYNYFNLDQFNTGPNNGHVLWDQHAIVDSTITNAVGGDGRYCIYVTAKQFSVMGNHLDNGGTGTHTFRSEHMHHAVISHNFVTGGVHPRHNMKIHAAGWTDPGVRNPGGVGTYSEKIIISDNEFVANQNITWSVALGPQDGGQDERLRNITVERNWFRNTSSTLVAPLIVWIQHSTIRNNIFNVTGQAEQSAIFAGRRGVEPVPTQVRFYNNTFYGGDVGNEFVAISLDSQITNATVTNNLAYAPNDSAHVMLSGTGASGLVATNNSTNAQVQTSPAFVGPLTTPAGFELQAGSYAINTGASVPVFSDYLRRTRPQNGNFDRGAMEAP